MYTRRHTSRQPHEQPRSDTERVTIIGTQSDDALWRNIGAQGVPPRGAKSTVQLATMWGCTLRKAHRIAMQMVADGKLINCGLFTVGQNRTRFFKLVR